MKKLFACLLALALLLSLAACGAAKEEPESPVGTWYGTINGLDFFAQGFDGQISEDRSIKDYMDELPIAVTINFDGAGNYAVDMSLGSSGDLLRTAFAAYLRDVFADLNNGVPFTDEELTAALGMDLESYVAENLNDEFIADAFSQGSVSGTYTEEKGTVTLDDGSTGSIVDGKLVMDLTEIGRTELTR